MKKLTVRILAMLMIVMLLSSGITAWAESYAAAVTASSLTVYSDAGLTTAVGSLAYHKLVTVAAVNGNVAKLTVNGSTVYASKASLTPLSEIASMATVTTADRVYENADLSGRSGVLSKGTKVYVLAVKSGLAMIAKGTNVGYTYESCLSIAAAAQTTAAATATATAAATTAAAISGSTSGVVIEEIAAIVSAASLPVYSSAGTTSSKLGTLSAGTSVTVCAYNAAWAYIRYNGRYGFCKLSGLRKATASDAPSAPTESDITGSTSITKPATAIEAVVTAATLRVYKSASTSATGLGTMKKGTKVNVVAYNSTWAYIELNGNYGYCKRSGLKKFEETGGNSGTLSTIGTATVIVSSAPVYTSASKTSSSTKVKAGTTVDIYKYDSTWAYIGMNGKYGYMLLSDLSATNYTEFESGDSNTAIATMEKKLLTLGYFDGDPSNAFDSQTTAALERFQSACGMTVTGQADEATQRVLFGGHAPASPLLSLSLSSGTSNTNVNRLQTRLYYLGYLSNSSSIDGDYGSVTSSAIKLFQSAMGMSSTGSANNATIKAMYSESAKKKPSGVDAADAKAQATNTSTNLSTAGGVTGNTGTMPSTLASTTTTYSASMSNAQKLEYAIYVAQQQLGKPYIYGSAGPNSFDCSGLTYYCYKKIGITTAHSAYSAGYSNKYPKVSDIKDLVRGDQVFFNTVSDGDLCDHTGIYLGANSFIHASSGGGKVIVSTLAKGYYNRVFSWGRRILET